MNRRYIFPILLGLIGTAILLALGVWQLQRLAWKEGILADMETRLAAPAKPLPKAEKLNEKRHRYRPVSVTGNLVGPELHVLTSTKGEARIRCQISAAHETEHLDRALGALDKVGKRLGVI